MIIVQGTGEDRGSGDVGGRPFCKDIADMWLDIELIIAHGIGGGDERDIAGASPGASVALKIPLQDGGGGPAPKRWEAGGGDGDSIL